MKLTKWLYLLFGHLFVVVGILGFFLPLLPGTPFLLLATFCYSRGSHRFESWLIHHPTYGQAIQAWRKYGVISRKAKILAIITIGASWGITVTVFDLSPFAFIGVTLTLFGVTIFLLSRPSLPPDAINL